MTFDLWSSIHRALMPDNIPTGYGYVLYVVRLKIGYVHGV